MREGRINKTKSKERKRVENPKINYQCSKSTKPKIGIKAKKKSGITEFILSNLFKTLSEYRILDKNQFKSSKI